MVGRTGEVCVEQDQEFLIRAFDLRHQFFGYPEGLRGAPHPLGGEGEYRVAGGVIGTDGQGRAEVLRQERHVRIVEVPPVVHCWPQQALTAEQLEEMSDSALDPGGRIGGALHGHRGIKGIDDVYGVLHDRPVRGLEHRNDPPSDDWLDLGTEAGVARGAFDVVDPVRTEIGACLARVERSRHGIQNVGVGHRYSSMRGNSRTCPPVASGFSVIYLDRC
jgi:hypothetical protein